MNPFKPDAGKKVQHDLGAARSTRDKLTERLKSAETAVTARRAEAQRLARDGADDAALDTAEVTQRAAQDRVATLTVALAETKEQVESLERSLAHLSDKKLRSETAAAIEKLADEIIAASSTFDAGAALLGEATGRASVIILDAKGLEVFTANVRAEVPAAVKMIAGILRDRAKATLDGRAPAALPKATPPSAPLQQSAPPKTKDTDTPPSAAEPVKHSAFEVRDRGKPYTLNVARVAP